MRSEEWGGVDGQVMGSGNALKEGIRDRGIRDDTCRTRIAGLVIGSGVVNT